MPDKPAAEVVIDERLVRGLLVRQAGRAMDAAATTAAEAPSTWAALPLTHVADGWDCSVWRLGDELAVRLPRRVVAAPLILHEQLWLPGIAARIEPTGIAVPAPVFAGTPDDVLGYPWPWSVVPWIDGESGLDVPRSVRGGWAADLAAALVALHAPAPRGAPVNPYRGVPLAARDGAVRERLELLAARRGEASIAALRECWQHGLDAAPWTDGAVWVHGDLHPGNLVARGGRLTGIIDFGDVTSGDPAYDLSVGWLAFDGLGLATLRAALHGRYDDPTWTRAHAWAAAVTALLLAHSDDNPPYATLGEEALGALAVD